MRGASRLPAVAVPSCRGALAQNAAAIAHMTRGTCKKLACFRLLAFSDAPAAPRWTPIARICPDEPAERSSKLLQQRQFSCLFRKDPTQARVSAESTRDTQRDPLAFPIRPRPLHNVAALVHVYGTNDRRPWCAPFYAQPEGKGPGGRRLIRAATR